MRMTRISHIWIAGLALLFSALLMPAVAQNSPSAQPGDNSAAQPEADNVLPGRFAFVVSMDAYPAQPLATAANDASLISESLGAAGFDVTGIRNVDQDALRSSYRKFLGKVSAAGASGVATIYISGYGVQFDGENYLIPSAAQINRPCDLSLNAVRVSDLINPLAGMPGKIKIFVMDLAYSGPFGQGAEPLAP
mgnify:FL=1